MASQDDMSPEEIAELQRKNCIFCKISSGEMKGQVVYKDSMLVGVLDINPARKGHTLLYPKEHIPILPIMPKETFEHMVESLPLICEGIKEATLAKGITVFMANGAAAGQQSPHFITHLIPNDGKPFAVLPEKNVEGQQELVAKLKKRLGVTSVSTKPDVIAMFLEQNPEARQVIIENPSKAKVLIVGDPEASRLFEGIDLEKLSLQLRKIVEARK
ncbi:MAG: HIT family protein [Candidatus Woesearchaeota archaeon]